jgi:hypothetical protein
MASLGVRGRTPPRRGWAGAGLVPERGSSRTASRLIAALGTGMIPAPRAPARGHGGWDADRRARSDAGEET